VSLAGIGSALISSYWFTGLEPVPVNDYIS